MNMNMIMKKNNKNVFLFLFSFLFLFHTVSHAPHTVCSATNTGEMAVKKTLKKLFCHYANKNSLTRDELANERSFLAYVRCATTLLVSSFSITQVILQVIIQSVLDILHHDRVNSENYDKTLRRYQEVRHDYIHFVRPLCMFICGLSIFTVFLGLKKSLLNFYYIAERAKIQPGIIGMGIIFLSILAVDAALLRQCIVFGMNEFST